MVSLCWFAVPQLCSEDLFVLSEAAPGVISQMTPHSLCKRVGGRAADPASERALVAKGWFAPGDWSSEMFTS